MVYSRRAIPIGNFGHIEDEGGGGVSSEMTLYLESMQVIA
jgi:hypothetical protein